MREQVKALAISSPILMALAQVYSPLQAVVAQLFQLRVEARLISALGVVLV